MIAQIHAKTDVGRVRHGNEDNFLVLDITSANGWTGSEGPGIPDHLQNVQIGPKGLVLVVSDGMGGALAGDVASRMAVENVRDLLLESGSEEESTAAQNADLLECLRNATGYANFAIHRKGLEDARFSGMGATFTGAAVTGRSIDLVQVGDSRAYVIRNGEIKLATKDQSLVQQLVDVGQISEQEAETHMFRNVILQALGAQSELVPVTCRVPLRRDDMVLLCSDGLSGKLNAEDIRRIVGNANGDLAAACDQLVREANDRGGEDNITVVLARFTGEDIPPPASSDHILVEVQEQQPDQTLSEDDTTETP